MVGRQQQPRCVTRKLTEGDAADMVSVLELDHVSGDRIVEIELALLDRLCQQHRLERLADRGEVEQRIGRDRPFLSKVRNAVVEKQRAAFDVDRDGNPARCVRRQQRLDLLRNDPLDLAVGHGMRNLRRTAEQRRNKCKQNKAHGRSVPRTIAIPPL
jgi:hypothetical protein